MTEPTSASDGSDRRPPAGPDPDELPAEKPDMDVLDVFEDDPSEYGDVNEFAKSEWAASKTARQRVKDLILRTTSPLSAADVADLADVSQPTARAELNDLAEAGTVLAEEGVNGRVYQRDPDWYRIKRVRDLARKPQGVLESTLQRLEREIADYEDEHGEDSPEELVLSDGQLDDEDWEDISHWRTALLDREYILTALQYGRLQRSEDRLFDGERGGEGNGETA